MNKVHLKRARDSGREGWWCQTHPIRPPTRYVDTVQKFLEYEPKERCAKCGMYRDLDEMRRR